MTKEREALRMAFKAWWGSIHRFPNEDKRGAFSAWEASRKALTEQGPFTYYRHYDGGLQDWPDEATIPLYTAPPSHEWVGLTDDEFDSINPKLSLFQFYKAIEAKLKEKNHD